MACTAGKNFRFVQYPKAITYCSPEVAKYVSCISNKDDLKKEDCRAEFLKLKNCFQKAVKDLATKKS